MSPIPARKRKPAKAQLLFATLALLSAAPAAQAQVSAQLCGSLQNAIGPWDYRVDRGDNLKLVESAHFTPEVAAALRGKAGYLGQDLDYTLRAFPNHHRALVAVVTFGDRMKSPQPQTLPRPVECYFERAVRWRADDVVVRMLYAQYLYKRSRADEAREHMSKAAAAADNALTHNNIALVYLEGRDFSLALTQAHKAQSLGLLRTEVRERLQTAGQWREPDAATDAKPAASSASSP